MKIQRGRRPFLLEPTFSGGRRWCFRFIRQCRFVQTLNFHLFHDARFAHHPGACGLRYTRRRLAAAACKLLN
jgi:hypothetical protein